MRVQKSFVKLKFDGLFRIDVGDLRSASTWRRNMETPRGTLAKEKSKQNRLLSLFIILAL